MQSKDKNDDPKKEPEQTTGLPPTPEKLTPTGAPVDERFASNPMPTHPADIPQPEEDTAAKRKSKSEKDEEENGDGPKGSKKRR